MERPKAEAERDGGSSRKKKQVKWNATSRLKTIPSIKNISILSKKLKSGSRNPYP